MKTLIAIAAATIVAFASANPQLGTMETVNGMEKSECCNPYWFEQDDSNAIVMENLLTISEAKVEQEDAED